MASQEKIINPLNPPEGFSSTGVEITAYRPPEGIANLEFREALRKYVAEELLELFTRPGADREEGDVKLYERFLAGEKIPADIGIAERFVRTCQTVHLPYEETASLKREWFSSFPGQFERGEDAEEEMGEK